MSVFPTMVLVDDQSKQWGEFPAAEALVGALQAYEPPAGVIGSAEVYIDQSGNGLDPIMKGMETGSLDSLDDFRCYLGQYLARNAARNFGCSTVDYPAEKQLQAFAREYVELKGGGESGRVRQ